LTENDNPEGRKGRPRGWPLLLGVPLIALLAIGAVLFFGAREGPQPSGEQEQPARGADGAGEEAQRPAGGGSPGEGGASAEGLGTPVLGSADAPVVMTEYSDYQ
jgi:hypothetical protein